MCWVLTLHRSFESKVPVVVSTCFKLSTRLQTAQTAVVMHAQSCGVSDSCGRLGRCSRPLKRFMHFMCFVGSVEVTMLRWAPLCFYTGLADGPSRFASSIEALCSDCECAAVNSSVAAGPDSCAESCELKTNFFHFRESSGQCSCCIDPPASSSTGTMVGTSIYQWKGVLQGYSNICQLCKCGNEWLGYHSFADCADTCSRQGFTRFQHANGRKPNGERGDFNCACCHTDSAPPSDPEWGVNVYDFGAADLFPESRFSSASISVVCSDCGCQVSETSWSGEGVEACAEKCELKSSFFQHRNDASGPCSCCTSPYIEHWSGSSSWS